ncbi:MAG: NERD domain-containing protein [Clostridium sp.]
MGLFKKVNTEKSTNENNLSELIEILLDNKNTVSKLLWNIYLPINKDGLVAYKHIDCILIRNDKIFVFCYENYKTCIGFKEVNTEFWEFEYFTEFKLEKNLITKANETTYFLSKFLNLDKKLELFKPIVILVGANSSKNIFHTESHHIYLREGHKRFLKEKIISITQIEDQKVLSDKWVLKMSDKLLPLMNPDKKLLKQIKKYPLI